MKNSYNIFLQVGLVAKNKGCCCVLYITHEAVCMDNTVRKGIGFLFANCVFLRSLLSTH